MGLVGEREKSELDRQLAQMGIWKGSNKVLNFTVRRHADGWVLADRNGDQTVGGYEELVAKDGMKLACRMRSAEGETEGRHSQKHVTGVIARLICCRFRVMTNDCNERVTKGCAYGDDEHQAAREC